MKALFYQLHEKLNVLGANCFVEMENNCKAKEVEFGRGGISGRKITWQRLRVQAQSACLR